MFLNRGDDAGSELYGSSVSIAGSVWVLDACLGDGGRRRQDKIAIMEDRTGTVSKHMRLIGDDAL